MFTAVQQPDLWEHLEQMFKLNQNHKGEEIYIEIKEEALITTESGGEYITGGFMVRLDEKREIKYEIEI